MQSEVKRTLYALLPGLSTESGHIYHYHLSVQRAVESIGWKYRAFIPRHSKIPALPGCWQPALANDYWDVRKTIWFRFKMFIINSLYFFKIFRKMQLDETAIVFLEHFELQTLAALCLSLLSLRPRFQFWILHRFSYGKHHFKTRIYRMAHLFLERKLGAKRVHYLTDSDLLAQQQRDTFERAVQVVPIPHTAQGERLNKKGSLLFWWPGSSMQEEKGLSIVLRFADNLGAARLVITEKAKPLVSIPASCIFVPATLSAEEYKRWMQTADAVLLPYSAGDYAHRTSGIFVETVCLGSTPVVSKGTWMAYELSKYNLSELAVDWKGVSPERIAELIARPSVQEKLAKMRACYQQFHCEAGFAAVLQELATRS